MTKGDYSQYSLSDFLENDFFIRWVVNGDPESKIFWESFQRLHPEKEEVIKKAVAIIDTYRKQDSFANEHQQR
jgi:transmembrane sensor